MVIDLIIFSVQKNRYAIDIENVQRIIQAQKLTDIPNAHKLVDGMMSYEDHVIKVINFRKMVGMETYDDELRTLFGVLKDQHQEWKNALHQSVSKGTTFHKTTDPHKCDLGKWLDNFTSYDEHVTDILKDLNSYHKEFHKSAITVLGVAERSREEAIKLVETDVQEIFNHTMGDVDRFIKEFDIVANSLQKLLLYSHGNETFAIKVDAIVDIAHIEEESIETNKEEHNVSEFLELSGVMELDEHLVNVIKEVKLPK